MANVRFSLTPEGHKSILRKGVYETFKNYLVSDKGNRYDVTGDNDLTKTYPGGTRSVITNAKCGSTKLKPISKEVRSEVDDFLVNTRLKYEISKLDCGTSFTAVNPKIEVDLSTYFNYIESITGDDNYGYSNRYTLPIVDSVVAIEQQVNPSTYEYQDIKKHSNINLTYSFNDKDSCDNYKNLNTYLMKINTDSKKDINDNSGDRFWSPFSLFFNTEQNEKGSGQNLMLSMNPISWVYAYIGKDNKRNTFSIKETLSISELESLSPNDIDSRYRALVPAAILGNRGIETDLYTLVDTNNNYVNSIDGGSTFTQRFENINGVKLSTGLVAKAKNFIQTNFTEDSSGVFTEEIDFKITNREAGGLVFDNIVGGNYQVTLKYDPTVTGNTFDNIINLV